MRWISRDPILFDGGYNVYEYVGGRVTGFVDPSGTEPAYFHNGSDKPIKYKHSERWANRKLECPSGVTCRVDGLYFKGWDKPPVKVYDNYKCATRTGQGLSSVACPRWQDYLGMTAHEFDWRKDASRQDWNPDAPVQDDQDDSWRNLGSPMP